MHTQKYKLTLHCSKNYCWNTA